jgi:uncharacterized coiled-coil protein SlyX
MIKSWKQFNENLATNDQTVAEMEKVLSELKVKAKKLKDKIFSRKKKVEETIHVDDDTVVEMEKELKILYEKIKKLTEKISKKKAS